MLEGVAPQLRRKRRRQGIACATDGQAYHIATVPHERDESTLHATEQPMFSRPKRRHQPGGFGRCEKEAPQRGARGSLSGLLIALA